MNRVRQLLARVMTTTFAILVGNGTACADDRSAIQAATDAFGVTVGIEKIGLYTSDEVRGFSPTAAGNLRIDGLYFDQAGGLNRRLTDQSTIRVGIASQAYPFPAPTGIVDYHLRSIGPRAALSTSAGLADYAGSYFETDLRLPIAKNKLGLVAGFGLKDDQFPDGSKSHNTTIALVGEWRPFSAVRLRSFWTQMTSNRLETQPILTVGGHWLPPQLPIRRYVGQKWETNTRRYANQGMLADVDFGGGWALRAGLFRSIASDKSAYADLFQNVQPSGRADHLIIADPPEETHSISGEVRITRSFADGPRQHVIYGIVRGRLRRAESGGSDKIEFGAANVLVPEPLLKPGFGFADQALDRVRQFSGGLAYELYWSGLGELGLGVQKTSYRKTFEKPGDPTARTASSPTLFYATLELLVSRRLTLFGGMTRGLEETGIAPDNAVDRGTALPAARTSQADGGLKFALATDLNLVASVFDVRKPYFNLDSKNLFTTLGEEQHKGIEVSLAGRLTHRLSIVTGAVLMDARVTGPAVLEGKIGRRPINSAPRVIRLSAEYAPPAFDGFSIDCGLDYDGRRVASTDNVMRLPARTILRAGARYHFQINRRRVEFRILADNITDQFSWTLTTGGGFKVDVGRRITGYLAIDM